VRRVPFEDLLDRLVEKAEVLRINFRIGASTSKELRRMIARVHLISVLKNSDRCRAMAFALTGIVSSARLDELDKPDELIARYAVEFVEEHKELIAEAVLTWDGKE
jgi:hypothetical protein